MEGRTTKIPAKSWIQLCLAYIRPSKTSFEPLKTSLLKLLEKLWYILQKLSFCILLVWTSTSKVIRIPKNFYISSLYCFKELQTPNFTPKLQWVEKSEPNSSFLFMLDALLKDKLKIEKMKGGEKKKNDSFDTLRNTRRTIYGKEVFSRKLYVYPNVFKSSRINSNSK